MTLCFRIHSFLGEVKSLSHPGSDAVDPVLIREVAMGKEVLISYVRKEAAKYARDLKDALLEQGLSVYLVSNSRLLSINACCLQ